MQAAKKANGEAARSSGAPVQWAGARNHKQGCACRFCKRIQYGLKVAAEKEAGKRKGKPRRDQTRKRRFVQEFTSENSPGFKNATQAAALAGYSKDSATEAGATLLRDVQVQKGILGALERAGVTEDFLALKMREGLDAQAVELAKHEGQITDERFYADHQARPKYLELAHRLRDDFPRHDDGPQAALIINIGDNPGRVEVWGATVEGEEAHAKSMGVGSPPSPMVLTVPAALPVPVKS